MTPDAPGHDDPVLGLDNVALDLPLAGLGSRFLAVVLDLLALVVLQLITGLGLLGLVAWLDLSGAWALGIFLFLMFLLQFGYFSIAEIATSGRTLGKHLLGLRTVSSLGGRPSAAALLIRNFLRVFDLLLGWPLIAVDRRRRRIGDVVASTLVVHGRSEARGLVRLGRVPASWGSREVAVVEGFLGRAGRMEPDLARTQARRLLAWMERTAPEVSAPHPDGDPVEVLRRTLAAEESAAL